MNATYLHNRDDALAIAYDIRRRAGRAFGGAASPWYARSETKNLMHTGPVLSAVPGRTDRHTTHVPGSSYVFPADFVSHLGENNTLAGMKVLNRMGFNSGPYGLPAPHIKHGAGPPHPPRISGLGLGRAFGGNIIDLAPYRHRDQGAGRGNGVGEPTPVVIAGGEYVATPESIHDVLGTSNMKAAHDALDKWVMSTRKDHIRALKELKPPVKS
jgi:hypothetical protein